MNIDRKGEGVTCTIADGNSCSTLGSVSIPFELKCRVRVLEVYVVPTLRHSLVLGVSIWIAMGVAPNLRSGEWHFATSEPIDLLLLASLLKEL